MKFLIVLLSVSVVAVSGSVPQLDGRIVGGQTVCIQQFPYQVSVRIYDQHLCGGCILDAYTILTAAHCVFGMNHAMYTVRVGATKHKEGALARVAKIIMNKNYNPSTEDYDMAILKLASPLSFNSRVQPIQLQSDGVEVTTGTSAWVSGWGVTKEGSKVVQESLRAVEVKVINDAECNSKYNGKITSRMLCAQTLYRDACQGDSGGPFVANGRLIGVVSWGYGCARPQYPGVFAKVSYLYSWIAANK